MARYLVVAHQTAGSAQLVERVGELAKADQDAEFVLLVPATPVEHLLTWVEGEARAIAQRTLEAARAELERAGARVVGGSVGDESPVMAVADELQHRRADYDAIVICTFPAGISRWLGLDLPHQVERRFHLPVIHVVAQRQPSATAR